jgi:hypothetical protein
MEDDEKLYSGILDTIMFYSNQWHIEPSLLLAYCVLHSIDYLKECMKEDVLLEDALNCVKLSREGVITIESQEGD